MPTRKNSPMSLQEFETAHASLVAQGREKEAKDLAARFEAGTPRARAGGKDETGKIEHVKVGFGDEEEFQPPPENVVLTDRDFFPTVEPDQPAVAASPKHDADHDQTGATAGMVECPHCGWALHKEDIKPTEDDILQYELAVASDQPFEKTYSLVGGKLTFRFRDISLMETDACSRQARMDLERGRVSDNIAALELQTRYQVVLALKTVQIGNRLTELPASMTDWKVEPLEKGETPLPAILELLREETIRSASLYRQMGTQWGRFRRLVAKLEDNADNDPFWVVTGSGG